MGRLFQVVRGGLPLSDAGMSGRESGSGKLRRRLLPPRTVHDAAVPRRVAPLVALVALLKLLPPGAADQSPRMQGKTTAKSIQGVVVIKSRVFGI